MNRPSQSDLLGYLLGALEKDEQEYVENALESDPTLKEELDYLESSLARLAPIEADERPPIGLARRTCDAIAAITSETDFQNSTTKTSAVKENNQLQVKKRSLSFCCCENMLNSRVGWTAADMIFASGACLVFALIFMPALASSRYQSQITTCQNNLREIGVGFASYTCDNNDRLIAIPKSKRRGFAGIYAPVLRDMELVEYHNTFFCPSAPEKENMLIPTTEALAMANGNSLRTLQKRMGGDYGYTMGYVCDEQYCVPRAREMSCKVILADSPDSIMPGKQSSNHGGRGQNVLYGDFSTKFLVTCNAEDDHIYLNDNGQIGPGTCKSDSVVGSSATSPFSCFGWLERELVDY